MKKKIKKYCAAIAVITAVALFCLYFINGLSDAVHEYARTDATNTVTAVINSCVAEYLGNNGVGYGTICDFSFDSDGRIAAVTVDSAKVNALRSDISMEILRRLEALNSTEFAVPLGNIFKSNLFSGRGPGIKIKIVPLGSIASETKNAFTSAGINQTRHVISLQINVGISILAPFSSAGVSLNINVPIAETIILGEVPNAYIDASGNDVFGFSGNS